MKPFDLKAALAGESVVNGRGQQIFISKLAVTRKNDFTVLSQNSNGEILNYYNDLGVAELCSTNSEYKLFMAPVERTVWVNLYSDYRTVYYYDSEQLANQLADIGRLGGKAHPLTYTV